MARICCLFGGVNLMNDILYVYGNNLLCLYILILTIIMYSFAKKSWIECFIEPPLNFILTCGLQMWWQNYYPDDIYHLIIQQYTENIVKISVNLVCLEYSLHLQIKTDTSWFLLVVNCWQKKRVQMGKICFSPREHLDYWGNVCSILSLSLSLLLPLFSNTLF